MVEHGVEVPNLHCPKFYKIRNTINNFQKLNFKNEVYLTLRNKSLYRLYSIAKVEFYGLDLESMIESESGKAKVQQVDMFQKLVKVFLIL